MLLIHSNMRLLESAIAHREKVVVFYGMEVLFSVYSIWNLDFLRLVYTPVFLQPHTNTLQVLALDYVIAVYPPLLIALSYLLVLLCLSHFVSFVPIFIRF